MYYLAWGLGVVLGIVGFLKTPDLNIWLWLLLFARLGLTLLGARIVTEISSTVEWYQRIVLFLSVFSLTLLLMSGENLHLFW